LAEDPRQLGWNQVDLGLQCFVRDPVRAWSLISRAMLLGLQSAPSFPRSAACRSGLCTLHALCLLSLFQVALGRRRLETAQPFPPGPPVRVGCQGAALKVWNRLTGHVSYVPTSLASTACLSTLLPALYGPCVLYAVLCGLLLLRGCLQRSTLPRTILCGVECVLSLIALPR
jgi:hypothetical protein